MYREYVSGRGRVCAGILIDMIVVTDRENFPHLLLGRGAGRWCGVCYSLAFLLLGRVTDVC